MKYLVAPRNYDRDQENMDPAIELDPSKLDLREHRRPGPYRPGEDLHRDQFLLNPSVSPIASNPETGKRDFLYQYLEQNKEVMGPKTQMFDRFADPDDGTLIAADPVDKAAHGPQMTRKQFSNYMEMRNPGFKSRTDALRMKLINAGILRGV